MLKKIFLFSSAVLLTACTSISVTTPTPIVETPELVGLDKTSFGFSGRVHSGHRYRATDDAATRPPTLTTGSSKHVLSSSAGVNVGLVKRFKVGLSADPLARGGFATLQLQLLGAGRSTAKKGNFSFSIFGHAGQNNGKNGGDQSSAFGPGGQDWAAEIQSDWYDYGASLGYRITDTTVLFAGVSRQLVLLRTKIDQANGSPPQGTYTASDRGEGNKAMLGFSWGTQQGEVYIAADYTDYRYGRAASIFIPTATIGASIDVK